MHSIAKKFCVTKLFSENCVRDLLHLSLLALSSFGVDLDFDCQGHRWSVVYHVFVIKPMLSHFQKVWSTLHLPRSVFSCWLTTQDISNGTQHQFRLVNIIFCRWNTTNYVTIYRIFLFFISDSFPSQHVSTNKISSQNCWYRTFKAVIFPQQTIKPFFNLQTIYCHFMWKESHIHSTRALINFNNTAIAMLNRLFLSS